jgi:hypothetical protein
MHIDSFMLIGVNVSLHPFGVGHDVTAARHPYSVSARWRCGLKGVGGASPFALSSASDERSTVQVPFLMGSVSAGKRVGPAETVCSIA